MLDVDYFRTRNVIAAASTTPKMRARTETTNSGEFRGTTNTKINAVTMMNIAILNPACPRPDDMTVYLL